MNELAVLDGLASRINAVHDRVIAAATDAVVGAVELGQLLSEAKSQLGHGEWLPWIAANCKFGAREAQRYLQVFRDRDKLSQDATRVSLLGIRGALKALEPEPEPENAATPSPGEVVHRRYVAENWWTDRAALTLALDASGWEPDAIAEHLARPVADIEAILDPRPPVRFDATQGNGLAAQWYDAQMATWYGNEVEACVEKFMIDAYERALLTCDADGFTDVRPILESGLRRHQRRHEAAERRESLSTCMAVDDDEVFPILRACALSDTRWAVRCGAECEGDASPPAMEKMFNEQRVAHRELMASRSKAQPV